MTAEEAGAIELRVAGTIADVSVIAGGDDPAEPWRCAWRVDAGADGSMVCVATGKPRAVGRMLPIAVGDRVEVWGTPRLDVGGALYVEALAWRRIATAGRLTRLERAAVRLGALLADLQALRDAARRARARRCDPCARLGRREEVIHGNDVG